jgi:hypothetical protein
MLPLVACAKRGIVDIDDTTNNNRIRRAPDPIGYSKEVLFMFVSHMMSFCRTLLWREYGNAHAVDPATPFAADDRQQSWAMKPFRNPPWRVPDRLLSVYESSRLS